VFVVPINLLNGLEFPKLYIMGHILDSFDFVIRLKSMCRQWFFVLVLSIKIRLGAILIFIEWAVIN